MRVLMLVPRDPRHHFGGDVTRILSYIEIFTHLDFSVTVVCEESKTEAYYKRLDSVEFIVIRRRLSRIFRVFKSLVSKLPLQVAYYSSNRVQNYLDNSIGNFDLTYVYTVRLANFRFSNKVLMDYVDCISEHYKRKYAKWHFLYWEGVALSTYEEKVYDRFDHFLITSVEDKNKLTFNDTSKVSVIGNAIRFTELGVPMRVSDNKLVVCFIGKVTYAPNKEALRILFNAIKDVPQNLQIDLHIIGASSAREFTLDNSRIVYPGFVSDIHNYLQGCDVVVAPIFSGGGIQNKVIDGILSGKVVLASSFAFEGLGLQDFGKLIIDSADDIPTKLVEVHNSYEEYAKVSRALRNEILGRMSLDVLSEKILNVTENV